MPVSFGECELDESCFELRRRGRPVKLEPKVFDVLVYLVTHRDRVVTKHELLDALWAGEAVSDSVLPRCIAALRRAVGDNRTRQKVVATAHGRGYRFVAKLDAEAPGPSPRLPSIETAEPAREAETLSASDFVGRTDTLARLSGALKRAAGGRGAVALIVGEPGIGKTRLTEETAQLATNSGFEVCVGHCYEGDGAPAYWPWLQILRQAIEATPNDEQLRTQLGSGVAEIAELVPQLQQRFDGIAPSLGPGGEQARFRLYDAATSFLCARSEGRPLLLVVDDLHWADASSLGLLRFLARPASRSRILILGTYRDVEVRRGHPLADLLGDLAREGSCERLALTGLDTAEIESFVGILAGEAPRSDLVSKLREMTEGNPFFLREMVRLLADQGDAGRAGADTLHALALPQGVKDAIGRRLDALSLECNAMLRAGAVIGRTFRIPILQAMLELPEEARADTLLELLAEALDAGAIVEAERGAYSFAHALTRQTLYEELRAPARIGLHRRAGRSIEESLDPASTTDAPLAELAHHFFEAAPGGDVDKAIDYAIRAAAASDRKYAYDEAVALHERALEALDLRVPMDEEKRAELTLALGEAQFTAGQRTAAQATLLASAQIARQLGRIDLVAQAVIAIRGFGELGSPPGEGVVELLNEALAELPQDAFALRSRLLSRQGGVGAVRMEEREKVSQRAFELAERSGDSLALRDALSARWWATLGPDRIAERGVVASAMRKLSSQTSDPRTLLLSLECELGMHLVLGDFASTERCLDEYDQVAAQLRQPLFIFMGMNHRTSWLISRGQFQRADERVTQALEFGRDVVPFAEAACTGQRYWSRASRGLTEGKLQNVELLEDLMSTTFLQSETSQIFLATLAYSADRDAGAAIAKLSHLDYSAIDRDEHWLLAMTSLSDVAIEAGGRETIEWLYAALTPYVDLIGVHDLLRAGRGSVASTLGGLIGELGDLDASVRLFERGLEKEIAVDMRTAQTASRLGLAQSLRRRAHEGDLSAANALIEIAGADARELGLDLAGSQFELLKKLRADEKPS